MRIGMVEATAWSFDLDDTLFRREGIVRGAGAVRGLFKSPPEMSSSVLDLYQGPSDRPLSVTEIVSFITHRRRKIFPGVQTTLEKIADDGVLIYGNTGRSSKRMWVNMTLEALQQNGIGHLFQDVFFTPRKTDTALSKAAGLIKLTDRYSHVKHVDDDPRTVMFLAPIFPDMEFYLIQHGGAGLLYSRYESQNYPNVHRIVSVSDLKK